MLEAHELRTIIDGVLVAGDVGPDLVKTDPVMRAAILLGLNAGLGNTDCSDLQFGHLDLSNGWLDYPRPKTGVRRRCPLWPETAAAIKNVIDHHRPKPARHQDCGHTFLTERGTVLIRVTEKNHTDLVSLRFTALLKRFGLHRPGLGFYTLRHVFRTVADEIRDPVAIDTIMGHTDPSMAAHYRERIDDARLKAVTDHVHAWLWPKGEAAGGNPKTD